MSTKPLVSIVIANYNYGRFLEEAIQSVIGQDMGSRVELIICDAGSTDNSVDIIRRHTNGLPPNTQRFGGCNSSLISWWCSEKDGGQSAAFNKGFSHANGKFLTWLNADDVLLPGVLTKFEAATKRHPESEWFVGGCLWLDPEMRIINCGKGRPFSEVRFREGNVSVWGPSSFFTKRLLDSVGGIDERFHYAMDSDLWLRFAFKTGARYLPFCDYAWGLRLHPDAKMSGHNFTASGAFDYSHTEKEKIKRNKNYAQLEQEGLWLKGHFPCRKPTVLSRAISASWFKVLSARIDLFRWKMVHYSEVFK